MLLKYADNWKTSSTNNISQIVSLSGALKNIFKIILQFNRTFSINEVQISVADVPTILFNIVNLSIDDAVLHIISECK